MDWKMGEMIVEAIKSLKETKTTWKNEIEISDDNAKGEKRITIKGKSDGDIEELIKKVNKVWDETK